jgi:hypothetical protein
MKKEIAITMQITIIVILFLSVFMSSFRLAGFAAFESESNLTMIKEEIVKNALPSGSGAGVTGESITLFVGKETDLEVTVDEVIYVAENTPKAVSLKIANTGQNDLTNISLTLDGLDESFYKISPEIIDLLERGKEKNFDIQFLVINMSEEKSFYYSVETNEITKKEPGKIIILIILDYLRKEIERLDARIENLGNKITEDNNLKTELEKCEEIVNQTKTQMSNEQFINVKNNIKVADDCIDDVEQQISGEAFLLFDKGYFSWIITGLSLAIMIIIIIITIYRVYTQPRTPKLSKSKWRGEFTPYYGMKEKTINEKSFEDKINRIKEKLKD